MSHNDIINRQTTEQDMLSFFNLDSLPFTVKALTFIKDGDIIAISGVRYSSHGFLAFSDIKEGADVSKFTIYRGALKVMKMLKDLNLPLVAIAKDVDKAPRFLDSLGFSKSIDGGVYYYG